MLAVLNGMTEEKVGELIEKYASGTASSEEIRHLMDWYEKSLGEIHWTSPDPSEKKKVHERVLARLQSDMRRSSGRVVSLRWIKLAAAILLIAGLTVLMFYILPASPSYITITNPSGKIQRVKLPDGSETWLNANSSIRYREKFSSDRNIELTGEAFFNVTHDPSHPFIVDAGVVSTKVLGTSFNVKAYPSNETIVVSVVSGKVRVDRDSDQLGQLTVAEQLTYNKQARSATTAKIDTSIALGWMKDEFRFDGEKLSEIVHSLENWYGAKIILSTPGMASCRYYLSFEKGLSLEQVVATLSDVAELKYKLDQNTNTVTLSGNSCQ